jgi:sensor domain CHASE-containing protein
MTRSAPTSDWVAYVVVLATVASMMLGKYLIAKGDEPIEQVIKEDIDSIENEIEETVENIEKKLND